MKPLLLVFLMTYVTCDLSPSRFRPHTIYGPPQPSSNLRIPSKLTIEDLIRLTERLQHGRPQNILQPSLQLPQSSYGPPQFAQAGSSNNQLRPPSTSYGVPDLRNIETLQKQMDALKPPQKPPTGFNSAPQSNQASLFPQQSEGSNNVPQGQYLPPLTTPKTAQQSTTTTSRPRTTTGAPRDFEYDYEAPTEEAALNDDDNSNSDSPNVSISNAVAGGTNFFYLQQPDGRLQRVVLQRSREPNGKPEEYVANYYFQNIQAVPNAVYTPLVSLGAVLKK
ncbi:uncharacterized protein LOC126747561 [Anthonomus grandis grandis]|uniref:uncharacterized protein LOC126747561 n=1 Tax=Anthonomus grandis grandis TaxID=2921223 RepID=UPI002165CDEF|nr:uncharacterized protein LOC126747561 [Anthonomus grandis grandis]XP_050312251.1 uncharacterized protein LOC126747561 [Anthonomus grandis grandis]XP_050312252.1 uncharacterized protein LOC126747561 [Anthonomus grandis grandis]XP_050312253.1 uncharacterized protein LOC126747561 [Anthonomus grandis grandis]